MEGRPQEGEERLNTAELVGRWGPPEPLRRTHRWLLGVTALRGWLGKEVTGSGEAWNLARRRGEERRLLPMRVTVEDSFVDGEPVAVLSYPMRTPIPFRWMRDELRWSRPGTELAGMTFLVVAGRRFGPTPFRLRRVPGGSPDSSS